MVEIIQDHIIYENKVKWKTNVNCNIQYKIYTINPEFFYHKTKIKKTKKFKYYSLVFYFYYMADSDKNKKNLKINLYHLKTQELKDINSYNEQNNPKLLHQYQLNNHKDKKHGFELDFFTVLGFLKEKFEIEEELIKPFFDYYFINIL